MLDTMIRKLIEETQASSSEIYLKTESLPNNFFPTPDGLSDLPPPPPPLGPSGPPMGPPNCSAWYVWGAVIVILFAVISLVVILVYFCRRSKDRRPSLDTIITNIELQDASPGAVPNRTFQNTQIGDYPARITIIQKY